MWYVHIIGGNIQRGKHCVVSILLQFSHARDFNASKSCRRLDGTCGLECLLVCPIDLDVM